MHIINKGFLKLALLPKGLYGRMGVNTRHLKAILTTKLTMDDRRPNTLHQSQRRKSEKPVKAATVGTILVSAFMGLIYLLAFLIGQNIVTQLLFYFSMFFFMLAASLISDFTSVLIDVRDNYILLPKPVSDRTLVTARILHIFIHICKLVVPMCLPGAVFLGMRHGILGVFWFLPMILLLTLFVIFFINALYIFILRITTPARFQSIISYIQICFAIALYASYQILPRMADEFGVFTLDATAHPALFILPMYWFASGWNTLYTLQGSVLEWLLLIFCIAIPAASLYVVIKYLAPSFNNKLALIGNTNAEGAKSETQANKKQGGLSYATALARLATTPGPERMGFLFTWKMTSRSRDFKIKVYPSIGYLVVIMVMLFLRSGSKPDFDNLNLNAVKGMLIATLYFTSVLLITAVSHMSQSERAKASWIYFIAPIQTPGAVISGAAKAALLKFYIPVIALLLPVALYFLGIQVLPNILLGLFNQLLITAIIVYGNHRVFPFSLQQNNNAKGGAILKNLLLMLLSGLIGLCHFLVYNITGVIFIFMVLSALATWLLMSSIRNTSWQKVTAAYAEA